MKQALEEAKKAFDNGEVPIGAVVRYEDKIIARGSNLVEALNDVTAHAEILAITSASEALGSKYLNECTMYVTLEPCSMCAGALYWCQLGKLVFAASDKKRGFLVNKTPLHPKTNLSFGLMSNQSEIILKAFFEKIRRKN